MMSKWCFPGSMVRLDCQFLAKSCACSRNAGRSFAPTQTCARNLSGAGCKAGLSALAISSVNPSGPLICVCINGRKSETGDIGTMVWSRARTSEDKLLPICPIRATKCPPAEWPAKTIGPGIRRAI